MKIGGKRNILFLFALVAIAQLWIPISMISKYQKILTKGVTVKMKMRPRDPVHPFKGKYLQLNFEENNFVKEGDWQRGESVFLNYHIDKNGFLKVDSLTRDKLEGLNSMKVKLNYFSPITNMITVKYPFDKYYIDESKAFYAEETIDRDLRDSENHTVYAEIVIFDNIPVLKEVYIDDKTITEFIKE